MRYDHPMRTTLDIDDDLVEIAKQLAKQRHTTMGQVLSDLARSALEPKSHARMRNGVPLFEPRPGARKPSLALVNQLRDEG